MVVSSIFCPNGHLMLAEQQCPSCGWQRPPVRELGKPIWGPLRLGFGLGGPGREVFGGPAIAQGVVVMPTRIGVLLGIRLMDGNLQWQTELPLGRMTRHLVAWGDSILMSISDERSYEVAGAGALVQLDPQSGEQTMLWECAAHALTPPLIAQERVLLRTSNAEIVCLQTPPNRQGAWAELWRSPTVSWWALPLTVSEGVVLLADGRVMLGEHRLLAIRLEDGKPLWQFPLEEMLAKSPVSAQGVIVMGEGQKKLHAFTLQKGEKLWTKNFPRIYSSLASDGQTVYLAIRSETPKGEPGHYQLLALDPPNGEVVWKVALPARSRLVASLEGNLYLYQDDGCIACHEPQSGERLWEYRLGGEADPFQTLPIVSNGVLVAGSYEGNLVALQVRDLRPAEPETCWQRGEFLLAAEAYALRGDYHKAAEIFYHQLALPLEAMRLYEAAQAWQEAARVAEESSRLDEALKYYEVAKDWLGQAEVLLKLGRISDAARCFEQAGDDERAGYYYEQSGLLDKAYRCAYRRRDQETLLRLRAIIPPTREEIEDALREKHYEKAAELAMQNPQTLSLAADLYRELADHQKEFEALQKLAQTQHPPTSELLRRMANLARRCGRFLEEGQTWESLGETGEAATAYQRAAQQLQVLHPEREAEIAGLYEKAYQLYLESGQKPEAQQAWREVLRLRQLPLVIVQGKAAESFREEEFNELELEVHNQGYGVAHHVVIEPGSDRFEIDCDQSELEVPHLAPGRKECIKLSLRPLRGQVGKVPLQLRWSWQDRHKNSYGDQIRTNVVVKSRSETPTAGSPVQIVYHGPVYTAQAGGLIQMPGGDLIQGDAQKGDRVEIRRGAGSEKLPISASAPERFCPNCNLPVAPEHLFCQACGESLKPIPRKTGRRKAEHE